MSDKSENISGTCERPLEKGNTQETAKTIEETKSEDKKSSDEVNSKDQSEESKSTEEVKPPTESVSDQNNDAAESDTSKPAEETKPANTTDQNDGKDQPEAEETKPANTTDQNDGKDQPEPEETKQGDIVKEAGEDSLKETPEQAEVAKSAEDKAVIQENTTESSPEAKSAGAVEETNEIKIINESNEKAPTQKENTTPSDVELIVIKDADTEGEKPTQRDTDLKLVGDTVDAPKIEAETTENKEVSKASDEIEQVPKEEQSEVQTLPADKVESATSDATTPTPSETQENRETSKEDKQESAQVKEENQEPAILTLTTNEIVAEPISKQEEQSEVKDTAQEQEKQSEATVVEEPKSSPVKNEAEEEMSQIPIEVATEALMEEEVEQPQEAKEIPSEASPATETTSIETEPEPEVVEEKPRVSQPITRDGQEMDPDILKLLEKYLQDIGVNNYDIKMSPGTEAGDNLLGIIAKVQISGVDQNGSNVEFHWIVKIAPAVEALRKMIKLDALYQNEVLIYESVFPVYKELENERSIMHGFSSYPEYLFSSLENQKETVVMTDMTSLGYVAANKNEPLDLEHVKVVMKAYGKLHAMSYVFQAKLPNIFEQFSNTFRRNLADAVDVFQLKETQLPIMEKALKTLDPIRDSVAYKKFSTFVENFMGLYVEASRNVNKYSVIGHGDSWINNMLFKYENPSNRNLPTAVCLLDFQVVRYGSPVCDLSYFLFTCTDKSFRDQHYDNVIKLYYYSLCTHLTDLGFDPERVLPLDILEMELRRLSVAGLYLSILALTSMTKEADETGDQDDDSKNQERIRDVILDFCQKGYLDFLFSKRK
ncbi:hypothetical protein Trydic_g3867 [Trypoxylus dichotomus]